MSKPVPKIEFRKARDFSAILNISQFFFRQHFKPLVRALFFIAGPFMLVGSIIPAITFSRIASGSTAFTSNNPVIQFFSSFGINILSLLVGIVLVLAVVYEYVFLYVNHPGTNPVIGVNALWKVILRHLVKMLLSMTGLFILVGGSSLLVMSLSIAMFVPVIATSISTSNTFMGALMIILLILLITLSIALLISPIVMLFYPAYLYEKVDFFTAIGRCFTLVKQRWWETFGLFFICSVVTFSIYQLYWIPLVFWEAYKSLLSPDLSSSVTTTTLILTGTSILGIIVYILTTTLSIIVSSFHYFSLIEQKEAQGLLEKIQTMGVESPSPSLADDFFVEEEHP